MKEILTRDQSKIESLMDWWTPNQPVAPSTNCLSHHSHWHGGMVAYATTTMSRPSGSLLFLTAVGFGVGHIPALNASAGTREQSLSNCLFSPSLDAPNVRGPWPCPSNSASHSTAQRIRIFEASKPAIQNAHRNTSAQSVFDGVPRLDHRDAVSRVTQS